jgi:hypothetical protein
VKLAIGRLVNWSIGEGKEQLAAGSEWASHES